MTNLDNLEVTHMDPVSRGDLEMLMELSGPCVSIYMSPRRMSRETRENPVRFKNLMVKAEGDLISRGMRPAEAREMLEPARQLQQDYEFWQYQSNGLAVFASPVIFRFFRLPVEFTDLALVGNRFHIKPLLPLLSGDGMFYVLALSQNRVRLLRGTRLSIYDMRVPDLPKNITEALWADYTEEQVSWHTQSAQPKIGARRPAMYFGQGGVDLDEKDRLRRFFIKIDRALEKILKQNPAPLVVATVEENFPIYLDVNTFGQLMDTPATGNPDELTDAELHQAAWELVAPRFERNRERAAQYIQEYLGQGAARASARLEEIVRSACAGRVDTLFVDRDAHRWGVCNPATFEISIHPNRMPEDEDLLDLAAAKTLFQGGTVWAVEPEKLPVKAAAAALMRY